MFCQPTVTIPAGGSSTVACPSAAVAPTPPVVTDNCGRTITPSAPVISPDPPCAGTKTYTYTYTACDNTAYTWVYTYTISAPTSEIHTSGLQTHRGPACALLPTPPVVTDNCARTI